MAPRKQGLRCRPSRPSSCSGPKAQRAPKAGAPIAAASPCFGTLPSKCRLCGVQATVSGRTTPVRHAPEPGPTAVTAFPQRIVCLTEEPTEVLYALGEARRIVGISGYTVRPPRARRDKPRISAFTSAKLDRILALAPDLAIGFSDMQADIAQALIRAGVEVWISNHRSVDGILGYVRRLGAMVGAEVKARAYAEQLRAHVDAVHERAARLPRRPRVYFEEWDEPQISAIRWVSELVTIAGGEDVFPQRAAASLGRERIVADPLDVVRAAPDIIIGSWCGKKFRPERVAARPGWAELRAVRDGELHEIKSPLILQPGPAALTDGLDALHVIISRWAGAPIR
jgi:iron complex transport system substrate-binding protein